MREATPFGARRDYGRLIGILTSRDCCARSPSASTHEARVLDWIRLARTFSRDAIEAE